MSAARDMALVMMAAEPTEPYGRRPPPSHVPPRIDRPPYSPREIYAFFKGGEVEADRCEALLARSARARGSIDLLIGEGLDALRKGERLPQLGYHLDDYGREVLDLSERTTRDLARLGSELRSRPMLRAALLSGRVRERAAMAVLRVARGDAEARWTERAASETVRALKQAVAAEARAPAEPDEPWLRMVAQATPDELADIDQALTLAARIVPGSSRAEQVEAVSQEFLGAFPGDPSQDGKHRLLPAFRPLGPSAPSPEARKAALEAETDRWSILPPVADFPAPEVAFPETATAAEIDARIRELARLRQGWDDVIGFCALAIKRSRIHERFGFSSFDHYVEERLGLAPSTVQPRVALEEKLQGDAGAPGGEAPEAFLREAPRTVSAPRGRDRQLGPARARPHGHRAPPAGPEGPRGTDVRRSEGQRPAPPAHRRPPRRRHPRDPRADWHAAPLRHLPRHRLQALHRHLEGRGPAEDALAAAPGARRPLVHRTRLQPPEPGRAPRHLPRAGRREWGRQQDRRVPVPPPPLHPRRPPQGVGARARPADVDHRREGVRRAD